MANKVKKDIAVEIEIPEGVEATLEDRKFTAKKDSKELSREIDRRINIKIEDNKVKLSVAKAKKPEKTMSGTTVAHIKNMFAGLTEGFEYELEICNVHFPMTVEFDSGKKEFVIKNLVGEKSPRTLKIDGDVEIEINPPKVIIKSYDKEAAGQVAGSLERVSRIRKRDRNKFQDGIFITKKPGVEYL